MLHEFHYDLSDQERLVLVLAASEGLYDPGEVLENERAAHHRLYRDLDAGQRTVYERLRTAGVLG